MAGLDSKAILGLVKNSTSAMNRGRVAQHQQQARRAGSGVTKAQSAFLDDMSQLDYPQAAVHKHPADNAIKESGLHARDDGPLTPTEHAWLARLPDDPTKVTDADATTLAALAQKVSAMNNPMDAKLVDTYWQPVKALHDQAHSDAAASNAAMKLPDIPASTTAALADAIATENPTLTASEALGRAREQLDAAVATRTASRARQVGAAR